MKWSIRVIVGVIVVGFFFTNATQANAGSPNSFKGIELGMSLEEFRQAEFPDKDRLPETFVGNSKVIPRSYRTQCDSLAYSGGLRCWFEAWDINSAPICEKDMDGIIEHLRTTHELQSKRSAKGPFTVEGARYKAYVMCFSRIDVGYGGNPPSFDRSNITYYFFDNRLMRINITIYSKDAMRLIPKLIEAY